MAMVFVHALRGLLMIGSVVSAGIGLPLMLMMVMGH